MFNHVLCFSIYQPIIWLFCISIIFRLEDGFILDEKIFCNDFVNLTHNMGVFLYDDLLAIVSLRYQTIHILQIRDSGNLVDVRAIGAFCREDDELFLNSNSQVSAIYVKILALFIFQKLPMSVILWGILIFFF